MDGFIALLIAVRDAGRKGLLMKEPTRQRDALVAQGLLRFSRDGGPDRLFLTKQGAMCLRLAHPSVARDPAGECVKRLGEIADTMHVLVDSADSPVDDLVDAVVARVLMSLPAVEGAADEARRRAERIIARSERRRRRLNAEPSDE